MDSVGDSDDETPHASGDGRRTSAKTKTNNSGGSAVLPRAEVAREFINGTPSDSEGLKQLCFHIGCAVAASLLVARSLRIGSWLGLVAGELALGLVSSFYFAGFHECIHGTAFASHLVGRCVSHLFGFAIFRGANWYYYFHWHHHRFTNDPERDPELSGTTTDRADPTAAQTAASQLAAYALFLSGYPFGFERLPGMVRHALGRPDEESWIDTPYKRRVIQVEYGCYLAGYAALALAALLEPSRVGAPLWFYWLLPHILGAGHLRYYQTAEHRGCQTGAFTDTSAWLVSRTTASWALYTKLAWNMPYHQEHHAWPNVPFYLLPALYARVVASGKRPKSGCTPSGEFGYVWIHRVLLGQALRGKRE